VSTGLDVVAQRRSATSGSARDSAGARPCARTACAAIAISAPVSIWVKCGS